MGHRRHDLELKTRIWIATIQVQSAGDHPGLEGEMGVVRSLTAESRLLTPAAD